MRDFVSFCQDTHISSENITDLLDSMIESPDIRIWAYQVYLRILNAVMKEIKKKSNHEKFFLPLLSEPEKMTAERRKHKLKKEANNARSEINNNLKEMEAEKFASRTQKIRKNRATVNREIEEKFLNKRVPDPTVALPAYFDSEKNRKMNQAMAEAAETGRAVTEGELKEFTNHLLVHISLKNGLRRQPCCPDSSWVHQPTSRPCSNCCQ